MYLNQDVVKKKNKKKMLFVIHIQCYADQLYVKKYVIFKIYIKNKSTWKIKKKLTKS